MNRPRIDPELSKMIQDYANKNLNGNFTKAVDSLIRNGLEIKKDDSNEEINDNY